MVDYEALGNAMRNEGYDTGWQVVATAPTFFEANSGMANWDRFGAALRGHYITQGMMADRELLDRAVLTARISYISASKALHSCRVTSADAYKGDLPALRRAYERQVGYALDKLWTAQQALARWDGFWSAEALGVTL